MTRGTRLPLTRIRGELAATLAITPSTVYVGQQHLCGRGNPDQGHDCSGLVAFEEHLSLRYHPDGAAYFDHWIPLLACLVAYEDGSGPAAGVIKEPVAGCMAFAGRGSAN